MEAIPVIAEAGEALGLPLAVTLALIILAAVVIGVIVLREHHHRIDSLKEAVSDMKSDMEKKVSDMKGDMEKEVHGLKDGMEKEVAEIKGEMSKQAAAHNAELSSLYKLINTVANDVSFIRGKMSHDGEKK